MASNLERKWRLLVETATKQAETNPTEDVKLKKRKLNEPPAAKAPPPAKKAAITPAASFSKVTVKKEIKPVSLPVKDSRSDSSFFSAPKPKPKLPSFKKAPANVKQEPDTNVAQPSSIDPFQEALKSMGKGRKASPAVSTPPPIAAASTPPAGNTTGKTKRKSVSWAPEGQLESIRLIERAVYDDDPVDGIHTAHSLRDLDRGEGAALHAHLFEELIDWTDPITIDIPIDIDLTQRGLQSVEKTAQEEREQTALGALYMNAVQIPDSPAEPAATIPEEDVDASVKLMTVGPESDIFFWSGAPESPQVSVADLVNQLAAGGVDHPMNGVTAGNGLLAGFDPNLLSSIPAEQMQQLMQQAQALLNPGQASGGSGQPSPFGGSQAPGWNAPGQFQEFEQEFAGDDVGARARWAADKGRGRGVRGRGGRGKGDEAQGSYRSSKRRPCSFFAEGRCRYGDQCDFSHEPIF
jgi:protein phosphatase 1 regulatory subunit 10